MQEEWYQILWTFAEWWDMEKIGEKIEFT